MYFKNGTVSDMLASESNSEPPSLLLRIVERFTTTYFSSPRRIPSGCHCFHIDIPVVVLIEDQTERTQEFHHIVVRRSTPTGASPAHVITVFFLAAAGVQGTVVVVLGAAGVQAEKRRYG